MARPTQLRVMSERPLPGEVEEGSPMADARRAARPTTPTANADDGARVVAYLQQQLAQKTEEVATLRTTVEKTAADAQEQIEHAYTQATEAVRKVDGRRIEAEKQAAQASVLAQQRGAYFTTLALGFLRQTADKLAWLAAFLIGRVPALGALYGGYLLWQSSLPSLSSLTLTALALYGLLIVLPTVWMAIHADKMPTPTGE